jgi:hypothetical protein
MMEYRCISLLLLGQVHCQQDSALSTNDLNHLLTKAAPAAQSKENSSLVDASTKPMNHLLTHATL